MRKTSSSYVVVRTNSAGVHVGMFVYRKGKEVRLTCARRIWSWQGANTLHEIALNGVRKGSRVSAEVQHIVLTEAIEVIACSKTGEANLRSASWQ